MGKSGRNKKGKQGHQAADKRSGSGRRTPNAPPPNFDAQSDSDEGGGALHIGGMVIRVDGSGGGGGIRTVTQSSTRRRRRSSVGGNVQRSSGLGNDSSSDGYSVDLDERAQAIQDYLADLEREAEGDAAEGGTVKQQQRRVHSVSSDGGGDGSAAKRRRRQYQQYSGAVLMNRFCTFDMHDEGPVADLGWPGQGEDQLATTDSANSSSEESSSSSGGSSSSDEASTDSGGSCDDSDSDDELTQEELSKLSLAQRFPVTARPRPPPLSGQQQQAKQGASGSGKNKKKHRPGVKGAKGGKLAPGEKRRLRHEGREAKRAARAAARGFDLTAVNRQLEEFVLRQGDMQAFGPFGKHEGKAVARLAALYGCRGTQQGSKKHRKLVVVSSTQHTCLPQGEKLLQVGQILAAQSAAERSGAAQDGRLAAAVAGQDLGSILPASLMGAPAQGGRWAGVQRSGGAGRSKDAVAHRSSRNFKKPSRGMLKPVSFVSVGAINPDTAVEVAAPAAAAAAAVAAAAAAAECSSGSEGDEGAAAGLGSGAAGREQQRAAMAAAAGFQLLEVVEDLSGGELEGPELVQDRPTMRGGGMQGVEEEEEAEEGQHVGLGSTGALYTRMTALSLAAPSAGTRRAGPSSSARGRAAAEGITNSGRLLGLGLALGIGPEVFGAPGPREAAAGGARWADADMAADLSPLSPLLSKSQLRKLQRRASRGDRSPGAVPAGLAAGGSPPQERLDGRKGQAGRSKQERRSRGGNAGNAGGDMQQQLGGLGLAAEAGQSGHLVAGDYGYFERHTTGIGSKLLSKWGFGGEGGGLGRQQQGRAEPIVAVRRAKKLGLGAID